MEEDLYAWGRSEDLPEVVIDTLLEQNVVSLSELILLTPDQLDTFLQQPGLLTSSQCGALKSALQKVSHGAVGGSSGRDCGNRRKGEERAMNGSNSITTHSADDSYNAAHLPSTAVIEEHSRAFSGALQGRAPPENLQAVEDLFTADSKHLETVRLLLLGKTGNGKSTTGNTILGQTLFNTAPNFGSVTIDCERKVAVRGDVRFEIMDSPGLYDTQKTHEEICTIIVQAVAGMHPGPHAVLYVIRIGRFTEEEFKAYQRLKALFDDNITRHIILLFTYGDELERKGVTLQELLTSDSNPATLKQILAECNSRCLLFNNVDRHPQAQVESLLKEVRGLVAKHGGRPYSCPKYKKIGQGLEEEVDKRLQIFEQKDLKTKKFVQELEHKTKEAERRAEEIQENFLQKEAMREKEERTAEQRRQEKEEQLKDQLKEQQNNLEKNQIKLQRLKKEREEMEAWQRQRADRIDDEEKKRRIDKAKRARAREEDMQKTVEKHKRDLERQKREAREERRWMEQERQRIETKHDEQRQREKAEIDRRNQKRNKQLEQQRKAAENREADRQREMEKLKQQIVKKEEPGFFGKVFDWVSAPVRAILGLFS